MRPLFVVLIIVLGLLQYKLWFSAAGIAQTIHLKSDIDQQLTVNHQLELRNAQLATHIHNLRTNKTAVESLAREELGMVKDNETYYQFVE